MISSLPRFASILASLVAATGAFAQTPFALAYNNQDSWSVWAVSTKVREAQNGDLVLVSPVLYDTVEQEIHVLRSTASGDLLSAVAFRTEQHTVLLDLLELNDGSFVAVGSQDSRGVVLHMDSQGQLIHARQYVHGLNGFFTAVWQDSDSTLILIGDYRLSGNSDLLIARVQVDGPVLSVKRVRVGQRDASSFTAARLADGGTMLAGWSQDSLNGLLVPGRHIALVRLDAANQTIGGGRLLCPDHAMPVRGIYELPSGDLLLAGQYAIDNGTRFPMLARISATAQPVWCRGVPLMGDGQFANMAPLGNGALVLRGGYGSGEGVTIADTNATLLYAGTFLGADLITEVKGSSVGDVLIAHSPALGAGRAFGLARGTPTGDLGCFSSAVIPPLQDFTLSYAPNYTVTPSAVTPLDVTALFYPVTVPLQDYVACISTAVEAPATDTRLVIAPVPVRDIAQLSGKAIESVLITDALGRVVFSQQLARVPQCALQLGHLVPGVYQLHVREGGRGEVLRFVKE